jgi:hypothetical protein
MAVRNRIAAGTNRIESRSQQHPFVSASGMAAVLTLFSDVVVAMLFYGDALGGVGLFFFLLALLGTAWLVSAFVIRVLDGLEAFDADGARPTAGVLVLAGVEAVAAVVVVAPAFLAEGRLRLTVILGASVVLALASMSRAGLVFFETERDHWKHA